MGHPPFCWVLLPGDNEHSSHLRCARAPLLPPGAPGHQKLERGISLPKRLTEGRGCPGRSALIRENGDEGAGVFLQLLQPRRALGVGGAAGAMITSTPHLKHRTQGLFSGIFLAVGLS